MIPSKLKKGDTIGVIAPSNYIEKDDFRVYKCFHCINGGFGI